MSAGFPDFLLHYVEPDPKQMALLDRIISKTKEGKIVWRGSASTLVAAVSGLELTFVRTTGLLAQLSGMSWNKFTVRDSLQEELLAVDNPMANEVSTPAKRKLALAVDKLYALVGNPTPGLDRAIDTLDKL